MSSTIAAPASAPDPSEESYGTPTSEPLAAPRVARMLATHPAEGQVPVPVSGARSANFAAAGLPVPMYAAKAPARHDSEEWDRRIGIAVHEALGAVIPSLQDLPHSEWNTVLLPTIDWAVSRHLRGRLDKARLRAAGLASQYLREFMPDSPAVFVGAEVRVRGGRVDLVWSHPEIGVWFDEVKTWRRTQATLDSDTWEQVRRYTIAGQEGYGDEFAGVRLLTLGNRRACAAMSPDGIIEDLDESDLAPAWIAAASL